MEDLLLSESEYRVMDEVWNNAPVGSGELVKILGRKYDWKKSTVFLFSVEGTSFKLNIR